MVDGSHSPRPVDPPRGNHRQPRAVSEAVAVVYVPVNMQLKIQQSSPINYGRCFRFRSSTVQTVQKIGDSTAQFPEVINMPVDVHQQVLGRDGAENCGDSAVGVVAAPVVVQRQVLGGRASSSFQLVGAANCA